MLCALDNCVNRTHEVSTTIPKGMRFIVSPVVALLFLAALKGKVEIKVFHSSQLGSDEQMMRGIKVGAP